MKISKILKATFGLLCARCHKGKLLRFHPYNLKQLGDTNVTCSNCGLRFSREPGFFFGSAYVSYMLTVAIGTAVVVVGALLRYFAFPTLSWYAILGALIVVLVALFPLIYVWARAMWLAFFVSFNPAKRGED